MIDVCEVEIISSRRLSNTASAATLTAHCQFKPEKTRPKAQFSSGLFALQKQTQDTLDSKYVLLSGHGYEIT